MTISGSINFSGLGSGTDFTSIIAQLKEVEALPMKRMEAWKSDWNKRYEAFGEIIAAVREAKENLGKLNSPQKFLAKVATSSNEGIVGAKANADAVDGSHTISVKNLASNAIWSFNESFDNKFTKINTSGHAENFSYTYKGKTRTLSVPNGTTLESFVNLVNQDRSNPGVKMSLVQTAQGYTIQMQGKESGAANDLSIHPSNILNLSGGTTKWETNSEVDPAKVLSSYGQPAKAYTYKLAVAGSATPLEVNINGDMTNQDLVNAINAASTAAGGSGTIASIGSDNKLKLTGVTSMETTVAGSSPVTTKGVASTRFTVAGTGLDQPLDPSVVDPDKLTYDLKLSDGSVKTITLNAGATQQDFINAVNKAGGGASAKVSGDPASGNYDMVLSGVQEVQRTDTAGSGSLMDGAGPQSVAWETSQAAKAGDTIQSGVVAKNLTYSFLMADNTVKTVNITSDKTMQDLINEINTAIPAAPGSPNTAEIDADGKLVLNNVFTATGPGLTGQGQVGSSSKWSIRKAEDARFTIDNWPQELTSSSNEVNGVLDGVTLTLKAKGDAQISVAADRDSVKENIQTVLDTLNTVVKKVQDLTKWSSDKKTVPITGVDNKPSYSSQFNSQKGSVLTGNYGVQLFNSRLKSAVSGSPPGFTKAQQEAGTDIFSGDFVSALAEIGIKTCTEEGNPNYGLFAIAPTGSSDTMQALDQKRFDDAIANRLDDVIAFFASDDKGSSSSSDFRYANHIQGMTKAGSYKVSYDVDATGNITGVFINGVKASESDLEPGTFTVSNAGGASGMSIHVDDLTPGSHSGMVSIQQGKVRQMEDFFGAELVFYKPNANDPTIGQKNGGLMILQDNYLQIMNNIDDKIEREQVRLTNWERTQRLAFARLETLLGQYEKKNQSVSSQISQLSKG